mgnify:FL=1
MKKYLNVILLSTCLIGCERAKDETSDTSVIAKSETSISQDSSPETPVMLTEPNIENTNNSNDSTTSEPADPTNLGKYLFMQIAAFANNEETDSMLSILLAGALSESANFDATQLKSVVQEIKISSIENGNVIWQKRSLQAAIVKAEIKTINRNAGSYGSHCILYAAIADTEFSMIRDYFYTFCEEDAEKVLQWKKKNHFSPI